MGSAEVLATGLEQFPFVPGNRAYDVAPDDNRLLMIRLGDQIGPAGAEIILVRNWFDELQRLVPTP